MACHEAYMQHSLEAPEKSLLASLEGDWDEAFKKRTTEIYMKR